MKKFRRNEEDWQDIFYDDVFTFHFQTKNADGVIRLEVGQYGLWVYFPDYDSEPVMLLDLFYLSEEGEDIENAEEYNTVVYDPRNKEDNIAVIRWGDQATISFDEEVKEIGENEYGIQNE